MKRAGKGALAQRFRGPTLGPGGVHCPCCGVDMKAQRLDRRRKKKILREALKELEQEENECES